jgi:hypothetical protein
MAINEMHSIKVLEMMKASNAPITTKVFAVALNVFSVSDTSQPYVRSIIKDLIKKGYPIASDGTGYWIIKNEEQLHDYVNSLEKRIKGIKKRIVWVKKAFNNYQ